MTRGLARIVLMVGVVACGRSTAYRAPSPAPLVADHAPAEALASASTPAGGPSSASEATCTGCAASSSFRPVEIVVLERRLAALKAKGGDCAAYGAVLERAYRSGQITIRPYMWRVGVQLASGEAHPNGDIFLAREIDSLNVGRRTFDDLVWSMEHEAAHLAFNLDSPLDRGPGDRADAVVRACRS
ncbi:MAG: hypothetical protein IPF47_15990 [Gemmatimonadetes bacterium]|jgi:hypothetical protein|nr:hypothetical protein [Gemmatimonadota bacterium]MBK9980600.1 hypothetical protein [Gemmatimonadota bacterium]